MKKLVLAISAAAAIAASGAVDTSTYAKKMSIAVNETMSSAVAAKLADGETIENFPLLVRLDATKVSYPDFLQPNGGDMMFVQGEGDAAVRLPHEIQSWNTDGESLVWVRVPELTVGATFDLYYSSTALNAVENDPSEVWSEYVSVLHYEESGTGETTLANVADSTKNATAKGSGSARVGGVLGGARYNTPDGCGIDMGATPAEFGIGGTFTFSTWLVHEGSYSWDGILYSGHQFAGLLDNGGFGVQLNSNTKEMLSIASGNWNDFDLCHIQFTEDWNGTDAENPAWKHFAVTFKDMDDTLNNNSGVDIYAMLNGEYIQSSSGWGDKISVSGKHITIGSNCNFNGSRWRGSFDESRLRTCASSEAWLTAERLSIGASALEYGAVEELSKADIVFAEGSTVVRNADGTITVTAELVEGSAAKIDAVFNGEQVLEVATDVEAGDSVSKTFAADVLPADTTWTANLRATDPLGAVVTTGLPGTFMTGAVTVTPLVETADEESLSSGSFKLSRPAAATQHALTVNLAIGGTAVNGQTYATVPVEFVFETGVSELIVPVKVLRDIAVDRESVAEFAVAPGQYATDGSTASVTIVNFRDAELAKFSKMLPLTLKEGVDAFTEGKPITDFPVLVRLSAANGFDAADLQRADHADLAFYSGNLSQKLPYEIESWDPDGESRVWVKVPELTPDLKLNLLYGSAEAANNTPSDVWTAYRGVWHLNEAEGTLRKDSTANGMDGEAVNGRVLMTDPSGSVISGAKEYVTVSMWVKPSAVGTWQWLVNACNSESDGRWGFQFTSGNQLRFWNDGGKEPRISTPEGSVAVDTWVRFDCVYDSTTDYLYVNGALAGTLTGQNWANGKAMVGNFIAIGGLVDTTKNDNLSTATFRDVRFSDRAMPAEWFKATWAFDAADCFEAGEVVTLEAADSIVVDYVATREVEGVANIVLPLKRGTGDVYAVITKPDGTTETRLIEEDVTGPRDILLPIADLGPAGWYDVGIRAETGDGDYDKCDASVHVCTAPVWVRPGASGSVADGLAAIFLVGREGDSAVVSEPMTVRAFVDGVERTVSFAAGVTLAQLEVQPAAGAESATMSLVADSTPVTAGMRSATVAIVAGQVKPSVYRLVVNAYSGNEVVDFPALVRLNEGVGGFSYARVRDLAGGGDIRFTLNDRQTVLTHEIDKWNPNGESVIWVKLPKLAKGESILMEVGGPLVTDNVPYSVFSDQAAVWHLNYGLEGSVEGRGYYANSATESRATMRGWDSGNLVAHGEGVVGEGQLVSTAGQNVNDGHYIEMSKNGLMTGLTSTFTASVWMKYATPGQMTGDDRLLSHKGEWNAGNGWELTLTKSDNHVLEIRGADGTTCSVRAFPDGANSGDWYHVVVAFDGADPVVYVNGDAVDRSQYFETQDFITAAINDGEHALTMGSGNSHNYTTFKGTLDEVRLMTGNPSAARVKADYETVANANFFSIHEYRAGFVISIW